MTIDKAIKEMELHQRLIEMGFYHEYAKAHKLSIEAMKLVKAWREKNWSRWPTELLPGETEE